MVNDEWNLDDDAERLMPLLWEETVPETDRMRLEPEARELAEALADIIHQQNAQVVRLSSERGVRLQRLDDWAQQGDHPEKEYRYMEVIIGKDWRGECNAKALMHITRDGKGMGAGILGRLPIGHAADPYDPSESVDADAFAADVVKLLGVPMRPPIPPAGSYGPGIERMGAWEKRISDRLYALSEENLRTRAIEPDEECYHVGLGSYVTEEQMDEVLPEGIEHDRFVVIACRAVDDDEASLNWNNDDFWASRVDSAIEEDDGSGCYWTSCSWDEIDYLEAAGGMDAGTAGPAASATR
ncbi:hypothetical protein BLEM_2079 [Bifidobacterium lemurum]|uniref:Uncharacterized protein n=1 Tax=Bifidobacterium lemurum TaxID=1603886 RepID=A0A261FL69_9BIFI|nr:hypothetical protein [Bifidobacterium lemurum]OZG59904.1 hypothetical protein BLEM_2079 [Bifidobacterium lemurum]QOL33930.1 hypothetical protein BL8807_09220 [Bifidobacterium lemurum]